MNRTDAKVSVEFNLWTSWTPPVEFNLWTSWTYGFDARCFLHTAPLPPRLAHFQHFSQCQLVSEECFSEGVRPASLICNIISRSALAKLHLVACCRSRVTIASVFSADSCCESQQSFGFGGHNLWPPKPCPSPVTEVVSWKFPTFFFRCEVGCKLSLSGWVLIFVTGQFPVDALYLGSGVVNSITSLLFSIAVFNYWFFQLCNPVSTVFHYCRRHLPRALTKVITALAAINAIIATVVPFH